MENHYYDAQGAYKGSAPANPGTEAPADAIRVAPPARIGYWPVLNQSRDGWDLVEDHRGRRGRVDGVETEITFLGPFPPGWSDILPDDAVEEDSDRLREMAYAVQADPHRDIALSYRAEAEGWRLAGNVRRAAEAEAKAAEHLRRYIEAKELIRARHPRTDNKGETLGAGGEKSRDEDERFYLTRAGTYHAVGCAYTTAAGQWLTLTEVAALKRSVKPCGRCNPPEPAAE